MKKLISKKMKLFILILFILSMISYASGFILLFKGGYDISTFNNKIKSVKLSNIKFYFDKNSFNIPFFNSTIVNEYEINDDINSLYFNLSSQNLELNSYSGDTIQIKITGSKFSDAVELLESQSDNKMNFITSNTMNTNLNIYVYVPEALLKKCNISIDTGSGDVAVYNLLTDSINISTSGGDVFLSNSNTNYLTVKNSTGDVSVNNIFSYIESKFNLTSGDLSGNGDFGLLDANNVYGDISLNINAISKDVAINCISGSSTLILPKNADYRTYYNTLSGSLISPVSSLNNGNKSHTINITTSTGSTFIGLE